MLNIEPTSEHPVPFDLSDELPTTHKDAVTIAANTAGLIQELGGSLDFDEKAGRQALDLVKNAKPSAKPKHVSNSGVAAVLRSQVKTLDFQAFEDIHQARNFITNRLVELAVCGDAKLEIKALELLGKHSDVGLFTERSEITVHHTTSEALENSIKERVKRLLNADIVDINPVPSNSLDEELGTPFEEYTPEEDDADEEKELGENPDEEDETNE
jgi:hypothetical protein